MKRGLLALARKSIAVAIAIVGVGVGVGVVWWWLIQPSPPTHGKTNLIVISLDTLRADRIGAYGYQRATTPGIDEFASHSVVFTNAVSQFTSTRESHRSLFTGRYPFRKGRAPMLAQILKDHGYRTAGFTGGGFLNRKFGFKRGHEVYHDPKGYHGLEQAAPPAVEWLEEHQSEPFYLFLHTYDAHCPYTPPEPYFSRFLEGEAPNIETEGKCGNNHFNRVPMNRKKYRHLNAVYDGGVAWTDKLLQDFFDELAHLQLLDHTVIMIVSDHGEALGVERFVGHGKLYEEELRVPFIVRAPGQIAKVLDEPVQLVDVLPTALGYLGITLPGELDGEDLRPVIAGDKSFAGKRLRLTQSPGSEVCVRINERWKLTVNPKRNETRLFDLQKNPLEDVAGQNAAVVASLGVALGNVMGDADPRPIPELDPATLDPDLRKQLRELGYIE